MSLFGNVGSNTALIRTLELNGANFRKGVTAPTDATIGSTPTVPVLLFDAVLEAASTYIALPDDLDRTVDMTLVLTFALVNVQINNDVASITLRYVAPIALTTASGPDKTNTQVLGTTTVTTGNGLAVNDVYTMEFTLPAADANNPLVNANGLGLEINLTNLTGVAAIHLLDASLRYEATR